MNPPGPVGGGTDPGRPPSGPGPVDGGPAAPPVGPRPGEDPSGLGPRARPGRTRLRPEDAERFTRRLDELEDSVTSARETLRALGEAPLTTGSGPGNEAIAAWYRSMLADGAAPAADALVSELDAVRRAVRRGTADWQDTDRDAADAFRESGPTP